MLRLGHCALLPSAVLLTLSAAAQSPEGGAAGDDDPIDEIIVVVDRDGDPVYDVDDRYEALLRASIIDDWRRRQDLEKEVEWRQADPDLKEPSRIKWGYSAQAESRMRRESDITKLPIDDVQPATIFRIEF